MRPVTELAWRHHDLGAERHGLENDPAVRFRVTASRAGWRPLGCIVEGSLRIVGGFATSFVKCRQLLQFFVAALAEVAHILRRGSRAAQDARRVVRDKGARSSATGCKCREETKTFASSQDRLTRASKAQRGDTPRQGPSGRLPFFFNNFRDDSSTIDEALIPPASRAARASRCAGRRGNPAGGRPANTQCSSGTPR